MEMRSLLESKINPKNQAPTVIESSSKFDGQQLCRPTDPTFTALKDLKPLKKLNLKVVLCPFGSFKAA